MQKYVENERGETSQSLNRAFQDFVNDPQGRLGAIVLIVIVCSLFMLGASLNKAQSDYNKIKITKGVK